jgi:hypothetical protein
MLIGLFMFGWKTGREKGSWNLRDRCKGSLCSGAL